MCEIRDITGKEAIATPVSLGRGGCLLILVVHSVCVFISVQV